MDLRCKVIISNNFELLFMSRGTELGLLGFASTSQGRSYSGFPIWRRHISERFLNTTFAASNNNTDNKLNMPWCFYIRHTGVVYVVLSHIAGMGMQLDEIKLLFSRTNGLVYIFQSMDDELKLFARNTRHLTPPWLIFIVGANWHTGISPWLCCFLSCDASKG